MPGAVGAVTARLGVFGGSFDPVHLGHLIVASEAARSLDLTEVRLIPVGEHPLKHGGPVVRAEHRLAMLRLAVGGDARFVVDDRECRRTGPSYTVETLRELRAEFPSASLFLMMGSDAAQQLSAWHEAEALATLAEVVELRRPGAEPTRHPIVTRILDVPAIDISATALRERLHRGERVRYFVPDAVADYIATHELYGVEA